MCQESLKKSFLMNAPKWITSKSTTFALAHSDEKNVGAGY